MEPKGPKMGAKVTQSVTNEDTGVHRGSTGGPPGGHRGPPGSTGQHRGATGMPPGGIPGATGGHREPPGAAGFIKGYRSHRLNRAKCDFELSLYSAPYKIVNS